LSPPPHTVHRGGGGKGGALGFLLKAAKDTPWGKGRLGKKISALLSLKGVPRSKIHTPEKKLSSGPEKLAGGESRENLHEEGTTTKEQSFKQGKGKIRVNKGRKKGRDCSEE